MTDENQFTKIGNVLHPVDDVGAAIDFYHSALGLHVRFADGDRYAALDAGGTTLALVGAEEDLTDGAVAASFKVTDLDAALRAIAEAGGEVVRGPEPGPHEIRGVARDPWSNILVVYQPR
jgi:predicted enzyme related to lactoylglutathione lyase